MRHLLTRPLLLLTHSSSLPHHHPLVPTSAEINTKSLSPPQCLYPETGSLHLIPLATAKVINWGTTKRIRNPSPLLCTRITHPRHNYFAHYVTCLLLIPSISDCSAAGNARTFLGSCLSPVSVGQYRNHN